MSFSFSVEGRIVTIDLNEKNFNADKYSRTDQVYRSLPMQNDIFGGTRPGERITASASGLFLEGTKLCVALLGDQPEYLNDYYGNRNGQFVSADRAFGNTAQNLSLSMQNERGKVMLRGQLRAYNHSYRQAEVNLAICIVNKGGQFGFVHNDGFWGADGWVSQTFESLPFVGFVAALMQKIAGDEERFKRAMIHASGSTALALLGSIGGFFGGPAGAALIAGAATPLKMMLEQWAGSNLIDDPVLRQEFEEATLGKYIIETITNMIAAGSGKMLSRFLKQQAAPAIEALAYSFLQGIAKWGIKKVTGTINKAFIKKIVDGLINGTVPYEWLNATIGPAHLRGNNNNQGQQQGNNNQGNYDNGNNNQWNNQGNNQQQGQWDPPGYRDTNPRNPSNWDSNGNWIGLPQGFDNAGNNDQWNGNNQQGQWDAPGYRDTNPNNPSNWDSNGNWIGLPRDGSY
ncbi:hypothetical protein B0H12DRAFT_1320948 [Mycena haematopus]|nr:hypothetical protein B0H12DRAFT_1320948 [Mycena haematopus]